MQNAVGDSLGKYEILEEIGRGGFATVYRALDTSLDRVVALKIMAPHLTWDTTFVARFQQEARTAANLHHPNIVIIYEVGQLDGFHFIAMEYLPGRSLSDILEQGGALAVPEALSILEQVASALDYTHASGLIHRDIKPSNIIVNDIGYATLTDFGIVRAATDARLTATGTIMGTPEYMSPEQVMGEEVGPTSDVYSLGLVCYEMLSGEVPFTGTSAALLHAQVYEDPPFLGEMNPAVPEGVATVIHRALAKNPVDRFPSPGEMARTLQAAAEGMFPSSSSEVGKGERQTVVMPTRAAAEPPDGQARRFMGVGVPLVVGGFVLLASLLVGGITLLTSRSTPSATPPGVAMGVASTSVPLLPMSTPTIVPPTPIPTSLSASPTPVPTNTYLPPTPTSTPPPPPTPTSTATSAPTPTISPTAMSTETLTPEPTASPTLTLTPTYTPVSLGDLLLVEDFGDPPQSKFSAREHERARYYFEGGEYHILVKGEPWIAAFGILEDFSDFILEADARFVDGPEKWSYGFMFRYQDGSNTYRYMVSYEGEYTLGRLEGGSWTTLTKSSSPHITTGRGTNHMRVVCRGAEITVYVNGHYLSSVTDHSFSAGKPGVYAVSSSEPNVHVAFDNFMVWSVP